MKRLSYTGIHRELAEFLEKEINSGVFGSYSSVLDWLKQQDKDIISYKTAVCNQFEDLFPEAIVEICESMDDDVTFFVHIMGVDMSKENHDLAHDLSRKVEKYLDGEYLIIPSFKSLEIIKKHYPKTYAKFLEKNKKIS